MEPIVISTIITGVVSVICALIAAFTASASTAKKVSDTVIVLEEQIKALEKTINKLEAKLDAAGTSNVELAKKYERLDARVETLEREVKEIKHGLI